MALAELSQCGSGARTYNLLLSIADALIIEPPLPCYHLSGSGYWIKFLFIIIFFTLVSKVAH